MNIINYFFRGIVACILSTFFAIIAYLATIFAMLFWNWNLELESIQSIHKDIAEFWMDITFDRE